MPPFQVCRVSEFINLNVSFTLKTLFHRTEQNDSIDDGLLNAKAADLIGTVRNIRRKKTDSLYVLDDTAQLKNLFPDELRICDLVQKHRDRIDRNAPGADRFDAFLHHEKVPFNLDVRLGNEDNLDHTLFYLTIEIPAEAAGCGTEPFFGLFEGKNDSFFTRQCTAI